MQKITPFLWFNGRVEEAIEFYSSIFPDSKITSVSRMGAEIFSATFKLGGQEFMALNGGPMYSFTPAISFFVKCNSQEEVDHYWYKLIEGGGKESQCGWLVDRFGLSWQIIPDALGKYLQDKDPRKAQKVMQAMMKMTKIDIQSLTVAYND